MLKGKIEKNPGLPVAIGMEERYSQTGNNLQPTHINCESYPRTQKSLCRMTDLPIIQFT